jgi:hypothetical protein
MARKEKFTISSEGGISREGDSADFLRNLGEVNAKYGDDAQTVFTQLALRLERQALEAVKTLQTPKGKGGRPRRVSDDDLRGRVQLARGRTPILIFADRLGICIDNLRRLENGDGASRETRRLVKRFFKEQERQKKGTRKPQ